MNKIIYVCVMIACIVNIDKLQAMKSTSKPALLRVDTLNTQQAHTGNRLQQALHNKKIPEGLKKSLEKITQSNLDTLFQEGQSAETTRPVSLKSTESMMIDLADYGQGFKLQASQVASKPSIIFTQPEQIVKFTPRTDLQNQTNFDAGHTMTTLASNNKVLGVRHYDAVGKETMQSRVQNSSIVTSLQAAQESITALFAARAKQAQDVVIMPEGGLKDAAAKKLVAEVVGQAADQNISFSVQQNLLQDTYREFKKLVSTGKLNKNTFQAWLAYPYDRIMEYKLAGKGQVVTISRNPVTGIMTMETLQNNQVLNQKVFKGSQLVLETNYRGEKLLNRTINDYDPSGPKTSMTQYIFDENQQQKYVVKSIFNLEDSLKYKKEVLSSKGIFNPDGSRASNATDYVNRNLKS